MAEELRDKILKIWPDKETPNYWNPEHGQVSIPEGWKFLPSGDQYLTRKVRKSGPHWISMKYIRSRKISGAVGTWAPAENIARAEEESVASEKERAQKRVHSRKYQVLKETKYQEQFKQKVLEYLSFSPKYRELAEKIATETAVHACVIRSGRVGRTRKISLEEGAALAAQAHIRHKYTDYENQLMQTEVDSQSFDFSLEYEIYREIKDDAKQNVLEFLEKHRQG